MIKTQVLREFSSGGVVFKKLKVNNPLRGKGEKLKVLWLIAKTAASNLFPDPVWRLPKGWIDDKRQGVPGPIASGKVRADETSLQSAAQREVGEEGGVEAKIIKKIGSTKYFYKMPGKGNILKFVTFYLMEHVRDLPEGFDGETSEVVWLPYDEAYKRLSFGREKEVLEKAKDSLP